MLKRLLSCQYFIKGTSRVEPKTIVHIKSLRVLQFDVYRLSISYTLSEPYFVVSEYVADLEGLYTDRKHYHRKSYAIVLDFYTGEIKGRSSLNSNLRLTECGVSAADLNSINALFLVKLYMNWWQKFRETASVQKKRGRVKIRY